MRKLGRLLLLAMCVTTLVACVQARPERGLNTDSNQEIINTKAVDTSYPGLTRIISSEKLIGYISVVDPILGKKGQFSKAQVTVQNLTENKFMLETQYQWQDSSGFTVGDPRPWKRFTLGPHQAKKISELSLNKDASEATLTVRLMDDTFIELNKQNKN